MIDIKSIRVTEHAKQTPRERHRWLKAYDREIQNIYRDQIAHNRPRGPFVPEERPIRQSDIGNDTPEHRLGQLRMKLEEYDARANDEVHARPNDLGTKSFSRSNDSMKRHVLQLFLANDGTIYPGAFIQTMRTISARSGQAIPNQDILDAVDVIRKYVMNGFYISHGKRHPLPDDRTRDPGYAMPRHPAGNPVDLRNTG